MTNILSADSEAAFRLYFDGPAVESQMDVRDLAPALLSAGNLLQNLHRRINPAESDIAVNIRATERGSFDVALALVYQHVEGALNNGGVTAALNLRELVAQTGLLLSFVKRRFHHGVTSTSPPDNQGNVTVNFGDNTTININQVVMGVADDRSIQDNLAGLVSPIDRPGIDRMAITQDGNTVGEVDTDDAPAFQVAPSNGQIIDTRLRETHLSALNIATQVGRKWRFTDGRWPFWAEITDDAFNARIAAGERWGAHDDFFCEIREVQWRDEDGLLHSDITVVRVINDGPGPQQLTIA
jgi:hypothetical protein